MLAISSGNSSPSIFDNNKNCDDCLYKRPFLSTCYIGQRHSSSMSMKDNDNHNANNDLLHDTKEQVGETYEVYTVQRDFFEEPVTFLSNNNNNNDDDEIEIGTFMATMDSHTMAIVTHGKSASGNGDEFGISSNAAHAISISLAELIRLVSSGKNNIMVPMAIVTILSPILAQTGVAYVQFLDQILHKTFHDDVKIKLNGESPQLLLGMAYDLIASYDKNNNNNDLLGLLSIREQYHIQVLQHLLNDNYPDAMILLYRLLEECPGDIFGLSLAMDVAHTLGDRQAPLRVATTVASYYNERGRRSGYLSQPSLSSHNIGSAYVALGLAVGGRLTLAEQMAEQTSGSGAGAFDLQKIGGITAKAMAHVYDGEGRVAEGNSQLSTFDGANSYEGCGWLFSDSRLALHGAKFTLDREGSGADRSALRMYDENVERVMEYSGFSQPLSNDDSLASLVESFPTRKVPRSKRDGMIRAAGGAAKSFLSGDFFYSFITNNKNSYKNNYDKASQKKQDVLSEIESDDYLDLPAQTLEDVFCWLPPTPQLLTDATLLLLRLTISGAIQTTDHRWKHLKSSWEKILLMHQQQNPAIKNFKLAQIASSLVIDHDKFYRENSMNVPEFGYQSSMKVSTKLVQISSRLRQLMNLGGVAIEENDIIQNLKSKKDEWEVVSLDKKKKSDWLRLNDLLQEIRDGRTKEGQYLDRDFQGWDMDVRPFLEYIVFHTACVTEDYHALCHARSVCSESVIFRPNSPEAWWKYSVILDKLGDSVAAEDARASSVSLGFGEGGAGVH